MTEWVEINNQNDKSWIKFDYNLLRYYGTPSVDNLVYHEIQLIVSNEFKNLTDSFNFTITNNPPFVF